LPRHAEKVAEFELFAGAQHPQTTQIRAFFKEYMIKEIFFV
jgi:hypothetical protein